MFAMEADTCAEDDVAYDTSPDVVQWKSIIAEYSDVFKLPGMPAERDTVHHLELERGSVLPYKRQYQVSTAELAAVRQQFDEYLKKGQIC